MKLLFDANLSPLLTAQLADLYPSSTHVRYISFNKAEDSTIWQYASVEGYTIVTKDADFHELSVLYGFPPKVIWIRRGNSSTGTIEKLLREYYQQILEFSIDGENSCMMLF